MKTPAQKKKEAEARAAAAKAAAAAAAATGPVEQATEAADYEWSSCNKY